MWPSATSGRSTSQGFKARVTLRIRNDVVLPANTFAELRQTSLFGEKFVALGPPPPPEQPVGRLANHAVIDRSGRNPETEEVLAALSALLNGGGISQLQTISVELSNALAGRESRVRDALRQVDGLVGALDDRKNEIVRALENVDALARTDWPGSSGTIAAALDNIPPALAVLADQRTQLTKMLTSLSNLGRVSDDVITNSREPTQCGAQQPAADPGEPRLGAEQHRLVARAADELSVPDHRQGRHPW